MISIKTAKALKVAGLEWVVQEGDFWANQFGDIYTFCGQCDGSMDGCTWLPRLDQLLAAIEARGWDWSMCRDNIEIEDAESRHRSFDGNSPEEAAAQALLWILKEGKQHGTD